MSILHETILESSQDERDDIWGTYYHTLSRSDSSIARRFRGNKKEHNEIETSRRDEAFTLGNLFISEPSGRTAPKGTGDGLKYRGVEGESLALACAAQGFPAPITRYTHLRIDLYLFSLIWT